MPDGTRFRVNGYKLMTDVHQDTPVDLGTMNNENVDSMLGMQENEDKEDKEDYVRDVYVQYILNSHKSLAESENDLHQDITQEKYSILKNAINFTSEEKYLYSQYTLKNSLGRKDLWYFAFKETMKDPILGNGALFYNSKYETYPHNFILEIACDHGIFVALAVIIVLTFMLIKIIKKSKNNPYLAYVIVLTLSYLPQLMVSGSAYESKELLFFIGIFVGYFIINKDEEAKY